MIIGAASERPMETPVSLRDPQIINAGKTTLHESMPVRFPILVAIGAEPTTGIVMPLMGKANSDAVSGVCPDLSSTGALGSLAAALLDPDCVRR